MIDKTLTKEDFSLLDTIITVDNRILTIMLSVKDNRSITIADAYQLYLKGQIVQKTVHIDGDDIFMPINEVYKYR